MSNHTRLILPCLASLLLGACSNTQVLEKVSALKEPEISQRPVSEPEKPRPATRGDADYRPIHPTPVTAVTPPNGSLFTPTLAIGIYQPVNPYQVGDMILVELDEEMSANKSLNYKADKKDSFDLQPVVINAGPLQVSGDKLNVDYRQDRNFDSSAQTEQKNSLKGTITVFVRQILANGNLVVSGEKWLTLNKGKEFIRFSGEIRPRDIARANNTISSVNVGNARIEFSAQGEQQDNQDPSMLSKLFNILG